MQTMTSTDVSIPAGDARLGGTLVLPAGAAGIVAFAHGSGSSRFSPRNREVATALNAAGLGTLRFDLLTEREGLIDERTRELRFDIHLLGARMIAAIDWLLGRDDTGPLATGLFGASTGAAAALVAAAARPEAVSAVVSRGGRPDLAGDALARVRAPTLLIVGGDDTPVIGMNRDAEARLPTGTATEIVIVPGATHLFGEPGAMDQVIAHAERWFRRWLAPKDMQNADDAHPQRAAGP
jgi:dienelactone hydrolase